MNALLGLLYMRGLQRANFTQSQVKVLGLLGW